VSKPTHAYIGTCPKCGKVHSSVLDDPKHPKETGKHLSDMVVNGLTVSRVPSDEAMLNFAWECVPATEQLALFGEGE